MARTSCFSAPVEPNIAALPKAGTRSILYILTVTPARSTGPGCSFKLQQAIYYSRGPVNESLTPIAEAALPEQTICREALLEKYAKDEEQTIEDVRARVAREPLRPRWFALRPWRISR